MRSTIQLSWDRFRASGPRARAIALALLIEVLIVLLFLTMVPSLTTKPKPKPTVFGFETESGEADQPKKAETKAKAKSGGGEKMPVPVQPAIITPPVPPEAKSPSKVLWLPRPDYSAADLTKQGSAPATSQGQGRSDAPDSALAAGRGPHGEPLYAAEWYREPTNRELSPYIPERVRGRGGWGVIACRTVENYRVEDCQELDDSPRGSGYAGAVRQAAWQFRVRPPRVGGKAMVGTWVRILIRYTVEEVQGDAGRPGPQ